MTEFESVLVVVGLLSLLGVAVLTLAYLILFVTDKWKEPRRNLAMLRETIKRTNRRITALEVRLRELGVDPRSVKP